MLVMILLGRKFVNGAIQDAADSLEVDELPDRKK
jgi:hypothetical protein